MGRNINNVKKRAGEYKFAMPFEEIDGGGELHYDCKVDGSVLARIAERGMSLKLSSMGES